MTMTCQRCELLRKMAADLLSERDEARAERDGAIEAMDTATECMNNRDAENARLLNYVALLTVEVHYLMAFAVAHGFGNPTAERIQRGQRLRKELGIPDDISWARALEPKP